MTFPSFTQQIFLYWSPFVRPRYGVLALNKTDGSPTLTDLTFQETDSKESHPTGQQVPGEELFRLRHPKCKGQEVEKPRVPAGRRSLAFIKSAGGQQECWGLALEALEGGHGGLPWRRRPVNAAGCWWRQRVCGWLVGPWESISSPGFWPKPLGAKYTLQGGRKRPRVSSLGGTLAQKDAEAQMGVEAGC